LIGLLQRVLSLFGKDFKKGLDKGKKILTFAIPNEREPKSGCSEAE